MLVIKIVLAIMFSQYYRMIYIFNILVCSALLIFFMESQVSND